MLLVEEYTKKTPALSPPSFIEALVRLRARRGYPLFVVSDNGKTFKDARL